MSSKKKLALSITTLAIVLIAMIGMTVAVFAANQVVVTNQITVTYTVSEVLANVQAKYTYGYDTTNTDYLWEYMTTDGTASGANRLNFTANGLAQDSGSLQPQSTGNRIAFDSTNHVVKLQYTFENTSDATTGKDFTAQLTIPSNGTYTNLTVSEEISGTTAPTGNVAIPSGSNQTRTFTVAKGTTVTYTLTFTINNTAAEAQLSAGFSWQLDPVV